MTEIVDVDQMESAPLPVPSTSRTPVPRLLTSAASSSLSTPPAPAPHLQHQRITRSQTVATASASGSLPRADVPTARHPLHHGAKVSPKREPSTSDLSTPPDASTSRRSSHSPTARSVAPDLRDSWDNTGEQGVAAERSPSLVPSLLASGASRTGTLQPGASRSTRPNESMFENPEHKLDYPRALVEPLTQSTIASMPLVNIDLTTKHPCRPSLPPSDPPRKRKKQASDSDDDGQPLLSEYMCPICFSPPKSAVITPCGHILCGACLHGATTARAPNTQPLCPVCRTPIPGLRFAIPEHHSYPGILHPQRPQSQGAGGRRRRRRHAPPPSRTLGNGVSLPTRGEEMIDLDRLEAESQVIDVSDGESEEELEDPGRSGVIGLELLTMGSL